MKNAFITEAETVNAGTKFIVRDIASNNKWESTERKSSWDKKGRDAQMERKGVGARSSEERSKEAKSSI